MNLQLLKYVCQTTLLHIEFTGRGLKGLEKPVEATTLASQRGKGISVKVYERRTGDDITSKFKGDGVNTVLLCRQNKQAVKGKSGWMALPVFKTEAGELVTLTPVSFS